MLQSGALKGLLLHPAVRASVKNDRTHVCAAARDQTVLYACEPVNVDRACSRFTAWVSLKKERAFSKARHYRAQAVAAWEEGTGWRRPGQEGEAAASAIDPHAPPADSAPLSKAAAAAPPAALERMYGRDGPLRSLVMYLVAHASRGFMTRLNTTLVEGEQHLADALARPAGTPLITVSNHVAAMDDPLVVAAITPPALFSQPEALRWTMCATDRCFHKGALASSFFTAAKVLPVERGAGLLQPGLAAAEARLARGEWVHVFPTGTRSQDGSLGLVRKGVGRLVVAAVAQGAAAGAAGPACADGAGAATPLVVPWVHSGMGQVMPRGARAPAIGRTVRVLVGPPVPLADLLQAAPAAGWAEEAVDAQLTAALAAAASQAGPGGHAAGAADAAGPWGAARHGGQRGGACSSGWAARGGHEGPGCGIAASTGSGGSSSVPAWSPGASVADAPRGWSSSTASLAALLAGWQRDGSASSADAAVRAYVAQRRRRVEGMLGLAAGQAPAGSLCQPA